MVNNSFSAFANRCRQSHTESTKCFAIYLKSSCKGKKTSKTPSAQEGVDSTSWIDLAKVVVDSMADAVSLAIAALPDSTPTWKFASFYKVYRVWV